MFSQIGGIADASEALVAVYRVAELCCSTMYRVAELCCSTIYRVAAPHRDALLYAPIPALVISIRALASEARVPLP